jgi:hypothetical protein
MGTQFNMLYSMNRNTNKIARKVEWNDIKSAFDVIPYSTLFVWHPSIATAFDQEKEETIASSTEHYWLNKMNFTLKICSSSTEHYWLCTSASWVAKTYP